MAVVEASLQKKDLGPSRASSSGWMNNGNPQVNVLFGRSNKTLIYGQAPSDKILHIHACS